MGAVADLDRRLAALAAVLVPPPEVPSPVAFAQRVGFTPDAWQAEVLESPADRVILLCTRQAGKSTTAAVLGLYGALYRPGSLVLVISPGERQSKLLFRKIVRAYAALGRPVAPAVENKLSLELANGSEIHALPGSELTTRGFSGVDLILEDEAARVPDDLYTAIRPMVATSGGKIVLMSTPYGRRGHFFETWEHGGPIWHRVKVAAPECPRIPADFLAEERRTMPIQVYEREYLCVFHDDDTQVFASELIDTAFNLAVSPLFAQGVPDADHAA